MHEIRKLSSNMYCFWRQQFELVKFRTKETIRLVSKSPLKKLGNRGNDSTFENNAQKQELTRETASQNQIWESRRK